MAQIQRVADTYTYHITLSHMEAEVLMAILGRVGGSPLGSRHYIDPLVENLMDVMDVAAIGPICTKHCEKNSYLRLKG